MMRFKPIKTSDKGGKNSSQEVVVTTPTVLGRQMSASLRERLKRSGRSYKSPAPTKRPPSAMSSLDDCSQVSDEIPKRQLAIHNTQVSSEISDISPHKIRPHNQTHSDSLQSDSKLVKTECSRTSDLKGSTEQCDKSSPTRFSSPMDCKINETICENKSKKIKVDIDSQSSKKKQESPESKGSVDKSIADNLRKEKNELLQRISEKEETLRKLKMVKMYRSKNNLSELGVLVDKWRTTSQEAVQQLHAGATEPRPTLTQLVNHLQLDHAMIGYDPEEETFD